MAALSAESMPPERPTTTRSKPTLPTSLRTKPTRIRRTTSLSIESGSGAEPFGGGVIEVMSFIPQEWVGDARPAHRGEVDAMEHKALVRPCGVVEQPAVGADHPRTT